MLGWNLFSSGTLSSYFGPNIVFIGRNLPRMEWDNTQWDSGYMRDTPRPDCSPMCSPLCLQGELKVNVFMYLLAKTEYLEEEIKSKRLLVNSCQMVQ